MASKTPLILITGVSGFIGYRVLLAALEAGYRVRGAIRRSEQAASIKTLPSVQKHLSNLDFVVVPDILAPGAYDKALKGVDYVEHVASPLAGSIGSSDDYEHLLIEPAIKGTTGILSSALKQTSVKRIVITSSAVVLFSWPDLALEESPHVFTEKDVIAPPSGPYSAGFEAYHASKVHAFHAAQNFVAEKGPLSFDIIHVMPSFVIGRNDLITDDPTKVASGTNAYALGPILGNKNPTPLPGVTVHVDDVARVHIQALDATKVKESQNFVLSSNGIEGTRWENSTGIVSSAFPDAVQNGILPLGGMQPSKKALISSKKAEETFGFRLVGYDEQVKSIVGQYLELLGKEKRVEVEEL